MIGLKLITLCGLVALATSQDYQEYRPAPHRLAAPEAAKPTPVPILKQINRHNEDGSYTYGYEGADGSFKIETKLATGEVKGKYGYVDETGKVRVVEYGANKYGFQPAGEGITVAPPTLVDETTNKDGSANPDYEDGSYYQVTAAPKPQVARVSRPQPRPVPQVVPQFQEYEQYEQPQVSQYRPVAARAPAIPSGVVYAPQSRPPRPEPVEYSIPSARAQPHYTSVIESAPRSAPPQTLFRAQPQPQQQPSYSVRPEPQVPQQVSYAPQPAPVRPSQAGRQQGIGRGVLDQLAKDYALPAGGSPALHDISFGYY